MIARVEFDISGEHYLDLEREARAAFARDYRAVPSTSGIALVCRSDRPVLEARFGGDPAGFDRRGELLVVALVLFGVGV